MGLHRAAAPDAEPDRRLIELIGDAQALIISMGAPRVTGEIMDACPDLRFIGELEGDRFANRIDVEAAWQRGIRTVDTTNGSSYGVSEWALTLMLIGLRNAGAQFRDVIGRGPWFHSRALAGARSSCPTSSTGRTVGLIGCGIIARRLLELLEPFHCEILVHDPYVPKELADIYDVTFTSLDNVLSMPDVVGLPGAHHARHQGHAGARSWALIRDGGVFVNVSRGQIVDSAALIVELRRSASWPRWTCSTRSPSRGLAHPRPAQRVRHRPTRRPSRSPPGSATWPSWRTSWSGSCGHETRYDTAPRTIANRYGNPPSRRA